MQVFNALMKIIKKNFSVLFIYVIVFLFFVYMLGTNASSNDPTGYSDIKSKIMIINSDVGGGVSDGLEAYLGETGKAIKPVKTENEIRNALFNSSAEYIISIPEGFTEDFVSGKHNLTLETRSVAGTTDKIRSDMLVEKYLDMFRIYVDSLEVDPSDAAQIEKIAGMVSSDLKIETEVQTTQKLKVNPFENIAYYFKFLSYSLMSVLILGVSTMISVFAARDFKNRLLCSPKPAFAVNLQMLLGNLCFAAVAWLFFTTCCVLMFMDQISDFRMWIFIINLFVFTLVALSLSFLLGQLIKGDNARSAVANVVALGSCFLGGVFVPQMFLSDTVKHIASFMPSFWYVLVIEETKDLHSFGWKELESIVGYLGIQVAFAVAFLLIAMVVTRQRKRASV